jgi:serine/threonine protein kinase
MAQINKPFLGLSDLTVVTKAKRYYHRWYRLCGCFLPVKAEDSVWRYSRDGKSQDALQGWKFHISATILEACDLFERVAPFLVEEDVMFKAPKSLDELSKINCGLDYGYHQVGKFITVYPATEKQAVKLAKKLHALTKEFIPISVPFDEQYLPESSVFFRYGAFANIEMTDASGRTLPAIRDEAGELVLDDRLQAIPKWLSNPFQNNGKSSEKAFNETPLGTTYKIFQAITQRGKGGTYQAFEISGNVPRLCIVKEGRRNGELGWNGQDGYFLVKNEFQVLNALKEKYDEVPQVFTSFEIYGNFYLVLEHVEGKSLHDIMKPRRRRFSIRQTVELAIEILRIIEKIHQAGWIWNDCKPSNLIVMKDNSLRPIDFESAYPIGESEMFDWKTQGFSKFSENSGQTADLYALGTVIYFLLTGRLYDAEEAIEIRKLRRNVSVKLIAIIEKLLSDSDSDISIAEKDFKDILTLI